MSHKNVTSTEMEEINLARQQLDRLMRQRHEKIRLLHGLTQDKASVPKQQFQTDINVIKNKKNNLEFRNPEPDNVVLDRKAFEAVMKSRKEKYEAERNKNSTHLRELNATRTYVLNERDRILSLREKVATKPISPLYEDGRRKDRFNEDWERLRQRPDLEILKAGWNFDKIPVSDLISDTKNNLPVHQKQLDSRKEEDQLRKEGRYRPYDGSLGLKSYEPWQLPHYDICRSIIEDEVTKTLLKLFPFEGSNKEAERAKLDESLDRLSKEKAIKLVHEEILLEVTLEEAEATAKEFKYLRRLANNMGDQACILESEVRAVMHEAGRSERDPLRALVNDTYYFYKRNRDSDSIWKHTQFLKLKNPTESELRKEMEDNDAVIIEYDHIPPTQFMNVKPLRNDSYEEKAMWNTKTDFWNNEIQYWSGFNVTTTKLTIPTACKAITAFSLSERGNYLAIGTQLGTVIIYKIDGILNNDFKMHRASYIPQGVGSGDSIIHLSWSLDGSRLASVTKLGDVTVWSIPTGIPGSREVFKNSIGNFSKSGIYPGVLAKLFRFSRQNQDFVLMRNNDRGSNIIDDIQWNPVFSIFFPSVTLLGSAPVLCLGMNNNCMLRIDPEEIEDDTDALNSKKNLLKINYEKISEDDTPIINLDKSKLSVDIFLKHKHPIIFVTFSERLGDMITVDDQGYVMLWRYQSNYISNVGFWFEPHSKHRIGMELYLFEGNNFEEPHVIYDYADPYYTNKLQAAEDDLVEAGFRCPLFRIKNKKNDFVTYLYRNSTEAVTESGAIIHEVTRQISDDLLLLYQTRIYFKNIHFADLLLGCTLNSAENKLVSLVLYPPDPADELPWIEVISIDLNTLKAVEPRIQIKLSALQYRHIVTQGTLFFTVTEPIKPFGVCYLILNMLGRLQVYSLLTGKRVVKSTIPQQKTSKFSKVYNGLRLPENVVQESTAELDSFQLNESLVILVHSKGTNYINIIPFVDKNTDENYLQMARLSHKIQNLPEYRIKHLLGLDKAFYLERQANVEATIKSWLYESMESAIQTVDGPYLEEMLRIYSADDRQKAYDDIEIPQTSRQNDQDEQPTSRAESETL